MADITCTATDPCSITVQVEPAPTSTERVQDLLDLFYLFLSVFVVIWGAKKLLQLFDTNHDGD